MQKKHRFHDGKGGAALAVRVIPRANMNRISEISEDGTVKIHLTAAPIDGKANQALIEFLSKTLDIPRSRFEIVAGETGRNKIVVVMGQDPDTIHQRLLQIMQT